MARRPHVSQTDLAHQRCEYPAQRDTFRGSDTSIHNNHILRQENPLTSHDNDFWLHLRQVGELYHPGVRSWPEISQYNYRNGEHDLVLFLTKPSETEIHAARTGGGRVRPTRHRRRDHALPQVWGWLTLV